MNSNQCFCHGNTFVESGSLVKNDPVKNDQNQETSLKIKTAAIHGSQFQVICHTYLHIKGEPTLLSSSTRHIIISFGKTVKV